MAVKKGTVIINEGPKNERSGSEIFRLMREGENDNFDIAIGQQVTVGDEVSTTEGQRLLDSTTWNFKEVKK